MSLYYGGVSMNVLGQGVVFVGGGRKGAFGANVMWFWYNKSRLFEPML